LQRLEVNERRAVERSARRLHDPADEDRHLPQLHPVPGLDPSPLRQAAPDEGTVGTRLPGLQVPLHERQVVNLREVGRRDAVERHEVEVRAADIDVEERGEHRRDPLDGPDLVGVARRKRALERAEPARLENHEHRLVAAAGGAVHPRLDRLEEREEPHRERRAEDREERAGPRAGHRAAGVRKERDECAHGASP
jgi:hypothetical protein